MAKIRAYVYKTTDRVFPYKVFPPVVILGKGDKLEVVNTVAGFDAFLTVGDGVFEGGPLNKQKVVKKHTFTTREAEAAGIYRRRVPGRGRWKEGNRETPIP